MVNVLSVTIVFLLAVIAIAMALRPTTRSKNITKHYRIIRVGVYILVILLFLVTLVTTTFFTSCLVTELTGYDTPFCAVPL
jgi:amino acid transporter